MRRQAPTDGLGTDTSSEYYVVRIQTLYKRKAAKAKGKGKRATLHRMGLGRPGIAGRAPSYIIHRYTPPLCSTPLSQVNELHEHIRSPTYMRALFIDAIASHLPITLVVWVEALFAASLYLAQPWRRWVAKAKHSLRW